MCLIIAYLLLKSFNKIKYKIYFNYIEPKAIS